MAISGVTWRTLATLNLASTGRLRLHGHDVLVYKKTAVSIGGELETSGRLRIGCRWDLTPGLVGWFILQPGGLLRVTGPFDFYSGCRVEVLDQASLVLGSGMMNNHVHVTCAMSVKIGDRLLVGESAVISDSDGHTISGGRSTKAPVVIGDDVWLGQRAMVLKGVTIGNGAVVAAGAVVTRDVPEHCLAAGVPATIRRRDVSWQM